MQPILTRQQRRQMRRHAAAVAEVMAATTMHKDRAGRISPVTDPAALAVLRRGFADLIRNDCKPLVWRLTEAEARALPCWQPTPPGATWWAAFGLDCDQRATWCARWSLTIGTLSDAEAADAAEVEMLAALAAACNAPGWTQEVAR